MKRIASALLLATALAAPLAAVDQAEVLAAARTADAIYQRHLQILASELASTDQAVRLKAIPLVGNQQDPETVALLLPFTEASNRSVAELTAAAGALGHIGSMTAEPALRALVTNQDPTVRLAALNALGQLSADTPAQWSARAKDTDAGIRQISDSNLAAVKAPDAVAVLIEGLSKERDPVTRRICALGLGRLGDQRAASALVDALTDPDPRVRAFAGGALAQLDYKPAIPPLLMALEANVSGAELTLALRALAGTDFGFNAKADDFSRHTAIEKGFVWWAENAQKFQ